MREETKRCSMCGEEILATAKKCKHCGEYLDRTPPYPAGSFTPGPATPGSVTGAETIVPEFGIDFFLAGRYQIKKEIGRGGMGVVYLAYDDVLEIDIALKVLPAVFATSPRAVEALKGEARTAMKLGHPGIVRLYNFVESPDANFLVMEYVEGKSLDEILHDKGKLSLEETLETAKPIAEALDYAHSQGVLHRDIKPGNILVRSQKSEVRSEEQSGKSDIPGRKDRAFTARAGRHPESAISAKLTDFGIACEMRNTMTRLTGRQTSGTLLYMSPEQLMGDRLDERADIYSFAATLYECLAGRPPFYAGDIPTQIMQKRPADIDGVPAHVNNVLQRGLSKDKTARQRTCAEVTADIFEPQRTRRTQRTPEGREEEKQKEKLPPVQPNIVAEAAGPPSKGAAVASKKPVHPKSRPVIRKPTGLRKRMAVLGGLVAFGVVVAIALAVIFGHDTMTENEYDPNAFEPVRSAGKDAATDLWKEIRHKKSGIVLRLVPAGEFYMGSHISAEEVRLRSGWKGAKTLFNDEHPLHKVKIREPFYIGKYEVTQKQWKAIMGNNPSHWTGDNLPVERVSWNDAQEFCRKAGGGLRLPTEAEWEYACRAGNRTRWCFGDNEGTLSEYAWYYDNSGSKTHTVGQKKSNAWGLYDMHGNVWEWCQDWYDSQYYEQCRDGVTNPPGPGSGSSRVLRGGSWWNNAVYTRSANHARVEPDDTRVSVGTVDRSGFRVVVAAGAVR